MAIEGDDTKPYETPIPYIYASLQITALRETAKAILAHLQQNQQPLLRREYSALRKQTISFSGKAEQSDNYLLNKFPSFSLSQSLY